MPPPQQERSTRTRAAIVGAAAEAFARNGYPGTSINAIIAASAVTKGAFYFHFESKEELAATLVRGMHAAWAPAVARWAERDTDALQVVVGLVDEVVELCTADHVVQAGLRLVDEHLLAGAGLLSPFPEWERIFGHLFHRARREGILSPDTEPETAARLLVAAIAGELWLSGPAAAAPALRSRVHASVAVLLPALATDTWARRWSSSAWPESG